MGYSVGVRIRGAWPTVTVDPVPAALREAWLARALAAWEGVAEEVILPRAQRRQRLGEWLDGELSRCQDELWARRFQRACLVPGLPAEAWLQRVLPGEGGAPTVLAGVRFKGGDTAWPFVDLLAWDRPVEGPDAWRALRDRLLHELRAFGPRGVRVRLPGGTTPPLPREERELDQWLVAGRLADLRARPEPWGAGSLDVRVPEDLSWYPELLREYAAWRDRVGDRGREVSPASEAELARCLEAGGLLVAWQGERFGGCVAALRGSTGVLDGFEVQELFLAQGLRGRRKAPILQRHLVEHLVDRGRDALYGTVHRTNRPSLQTALRLGRKIVESWWFLGPG